MKLVLQQGHRLNYLQVNQLNYLQVNQLGSRLLHQPIDQHGRRRINQRNVQQHHLPGVQPILQLPHALIHHLTGEIQTEMIVRRMYHVDIALKMEAMAATGILLKIG